jgi:predicted house-cleaning noncanonical NTP pyrophosphatase (MazG superfamily)
MGKLVRDRIPEIIRRSGRTPYVTTLDEQAYRSALHDKLLEEAAELRHAQNRDEVIDELADVLEVLTALAATYDVTLDTITGAARNKRAERGGFEMRLWLNGADPEADAC